MARCPVPDVGRQRGAGLVEVMVALVILAVGLLGIAGLQLASLQNNHSAALRSEVSTISSRSALPRARP